MRRLGDQCGLILERRAAQNSSDSAPAPRAARSNSTLSFQVISALGANHARHLTRPISVHPVGKYGRETRDFSYGEPMGPSDTSATDSPPVSARTMQPSSKAERRALGVFAVAAVVVIAWVVHPVGIGIFLGMLTAFALQPLYDRLARRTGRPAVAAAACVAIAALGLVATLGGLSYLFVARGSVIAHALLDAFGQGGAGAALARNLMAHLAPFGVSPDEIVAKLSSAATEIASSAAVIAATIAATTFSTMLALFFALMTVHFMLRHWSEWAKYAEKVLPLHPKHTRALLREFKEVGRTTLVGTVMTGLAQGALAAMGYLITGVPEAAFFGAATAVASLVPGVGTMLVWVPAGLFLLGTGHPFAGVVELSWGALVVVGACDYIVRPWLVGGHGQTPALLMFAALFGGIEAFGLIGLILGPLLMALAIAVIRIYEAESRTEDVVPS